jgi:type II secretion system protein N
MAGWIARAGEPLPRSLVIVGAPVAFLALTLFFLFLGFPYQRVADRIAAQVEDATGVRLQIAELGPHLGLLGPGLAATGVTALPPQRSPIRVDRLVVRPAWSLGWLRGSPAIHVDAESQGGRISGALHVGSTRGFEGEVRDFDLGLTEDFLSGGAVDGHLDAEVDLVVDDQGPYGTLLLDARDGSLALPGSPVALPFETLSGDLRFGGDKFAHVDRLALTGPILDADAKGSIDQGRRWRQAPLDLTVQIDAKTPMARDMLPQLGVRVGRDGKATVRVSGSIASPRVR